MKDIYVKLAQKTVETYIKTGQLPTLPKKLPPKMTSQRAGAFVSIHKRGLPRNPAGILRGCIGTFLPTKKNIAEEIIANAIAAATQDPRFPPITKKELPDLEISVDILSKPKKLDARRYTLNPKKYGLIVSTQDGRRGLLLPDIPGVKTAEEQVQICKRKAGIYPSENVTLQTFTVERHGQK